jgi:hypothetical protein
VNKCGRARIQFTFEETFYQYALCQGTAMSYKLSDTQFRHNKYITTVCIGIGIFRKTGNTIDNRTFSGNSQNDVHHVQSRSKKK